MSQLTSRANELKSQDAAEAARDPASKLSAQDAERTMINESLKAGGAAYEFDPNASPEDKAAQARSVCPPRCTGHFRTMLMRNVASIYPLASIKTKGPKQRQL